MLLCILLAAIIWAYTLDPPSYKPSRVTAHWTAKEKAEMSVYTYAGLRWHTVDDGLTPFLTNKYPNKALPHENSTPGRLAILLGHPYLRNHSFHLGNHTTTSVDIMSSNDGTPLVNLHDTFQRIADRIPGIPGEPWIEIRDDGVRVSGYSLDRDYCGCPADIEHRNVVSNIAWPTSAWSWNGDMLTEPHEANVGYLEGCTGIAFWVWSPRQQDFILTKPFCSRQFATHSNLFVNPMPHLFRPFMGGVQHDFNLDYNYHIRYVPDTYNQIFFTYSTVSSFDVVMEMRYPMFQWLEPAGASDSWINVLQEKWCTRYLPNTRNDAVLGPYIQERLTQVAEQNRIVRVPDVNDGLWRTYRMAFNGGVHCQTNPYSTKGLASAEWPETDWKQTVSYGLWDQWPWPAGARMSPTLP